MRKSRTTALSALVVMLAGLLLSGVGQASAHEERPATFPDGTGEVPRYLGLDNPRHRVVCKADSAERIAAMAPGPLKTRNQALLGECGSRSIQTAINSIRHKNTSVYVLPGYYTESKWANQEKSVYCGNLKTESDDPLDTSQYIGSLSSAESAPDETGPIGLSYADQLKCPHNLNLIAIFGDHTPKDGSIKCDSRFCGTQVVGTGNKPKSVVIDNKFTKLNAIRADRATGVLFRNFTVQQAEFNALYMMETDGFVVDKVIARGNDEYGILAFASDHGLIQRVNAYYNGDSGIYPGSAADVNGNNPDFKATRYAIEIRNSKSHHNMLGYSGTAGNSVYAHHNDFFQNSTGIATDSLFPGHPGLPQDHARWSYNNIYSNNQNYYERYVHTGVCDKPIEKRGYMKGVVCPVIPTPVGTGVVIAGGNANSTDHNRIYDNWRYGTMQFWVPAPLRDEFDPSKTYDTSNQNHTFMNKMGIRPDGSTAHNGMDHWWDDQGVGNCWENNISSRGQATDNFLTDPGACREGGSQFVPGTSAVKDAGFLSCSQYNRDDPIWRDPPNCNWFDNSPRPTDEAPSGPLEMGAGMSSSSGPSAPSGGTGLAIFGAGLLMVGGFAAARRRAALVTAFRR